ncbi:MAG: arginine--tRNA ligase, partial [Lachnospiraceae bacterium]
MKKILDFITMEIEQAFEQAGYAKEYAKVTLSDRPDLCEYQCNGALAAAKVYRKAPIMIAKDVVGQLLQSKYISEIEAVNPGFINIKLEMDFIADYLKNMSEDVSLGLEQAEHPRTIIMDYGGPNVAKPLHVGHLRSAIIGESLKRIARKMGHKVISDIHLGDWGLQLGLIIVEVKKRNPELVYFDDAYTGDYPKEAPFTITVSVVNIPFFCT